MKTLRTYLFIMISLVALVACNKAPEVSISGTVADAAGQRLLLYHLNGSRPELADSLTLQADGSFSFKSSVEASGPDFFCLMLQGQSISLAVDTLHTPITVSATAATFGTTYTVGDTLNQRLKQAVMLGNNLRRQLMQSPDSALSLVKAYKQQVLRDYIYAAPADPVSYYLLFETVSGLSIFDANDASDLRAYGAVANLWNTQYPASSRTAFLVQTVTQAMAQRQQARLQAARQDSILQNTEVLTSNFPELSLPDVTDHVVRLSEVATSGHVTLLSFTALYRPEAPALNAELQRLYARYKDQGLQIYQVCLDPDENFFKVSAANLPWINVRDRNLVINQQGEVQYSGAASTFNVGTIPTIFIIDRQQQVVSRVEDLQQLTSAIAKVM